MRQRRSTHNYKRSASTRWQSMRSHSSHIGPSRKNNNVQGGTDVVELDNEAHERNAREGSNLCNEPGIIVLTLDEVRQADGRTWVTHPCPSACCTLGTPADSGSKTTNNRRGAASGRTNPGNTPLSLCQLHTRVRSVRRLKPVHPQKSLKLRCTRSPTSEAVAPRQNTEPRKNWRPIACRAWQDMALPIS